MSKYILYGLIALLCGIIFYQCKHENVVTKKEIIHEIDSIFVIKAKSDTIFYTKYIDRFKTDTIFIHDTLTNETIDTTMLYHYKDSVLDLDIQAKKLDWLKYNIHYKDTITYYNKIIECKEKKKPLFYYGIGIGAGYGLINNNFDIFIGGSAGIQF